MTGAGGLAAAEVDRSGITATASSWEQKAKGGWGDMPPARALDGDLQTAWMAEGEGEWISFDLGGPVAIRAVKLAFLKGNQRVYTVDVLVSAAGADGPWKPMLMGAKSVGLSTEMETFVFPEAANGRYVRVVGHGNTSEKFPHWCNLTEAGFVLE